MYVCTFNTCIISWQYVLMFQDMESPDPLKLHAFKHHWVIGEFRGRGFMTNAKLTSNVGYLGKNIKIVDSELCYR